MCSSSADNMWGWMACSIILMDRWDAEWWTEGQKGTDACRSSVAIRPVSSCNYNGNSTLQMDAFTSEHNRDSPHVSESWRLWGKQLTLNGGTSIISLLHLQPLTSPLMPGDHSLMLLSPAFDSAIMFKDSHFNTTSMKRVTCLPRSSAGEHRDPCCSESNPTHTQNRHKQMHYRRGNNAKLLRNHHMSNKGVVEMKQREMLGDVEGWTFSGTQKYSLSLRKSTKHQQILLPTALQWIFPPNRVGFTDFLTFNFQLHRNFHVGT